MATARDDEDEIVRILKNGADDYVAGRQNGLDVISPVNDEGVFTEEVGVDPRADGGAAIYHARVSELVHTGRAYARIENGRVVFKAEVGAVSRHACQVQGVWVHPALRGRRLSVPAMAAVVRHCLRDHADVVSLYVNDYNARARASYASVGFSEVGTCATELF